MRDCDVTCHKASRMPNGNGFSHSLTNFHKKIHESRETFAYGPSSIRVRPILGLYKFETEKTPRFEPRGDIDTHVFPGLSPETLVSRRDYSHRYRVSTVFESHPLRLSVLSERE